MVSVLSALQTLLKFCAPNLEKEHWASLDLELKRKLSPLHHDIAHCDDPALLGALGNQVTLEIQAFLQEKSPLFTENCNQQSRGQYISHQNKTIAQLLEYKRELRKACKSGGKRGQTKISRLPESNQ